MFCPEVTARPDSVTGPECSIVVTAGATVVPAALLRYLKPGGRMVLPLAQPGEERGAQRLTVLDVTPGGVKEQKLDAVRFVPLLSGLA